MVAFRSHGEKMLSQCTQSPPQKENYADVPDENAGNGDGYAHVQVESFLAVGALVVTEQLLFEHSIPIFSLLVVSAIEER